MWSGPVTRCLGFLLIGNMTPLVLAAPYGSLAMIRILLRVC
jgi:hypothetical protein